MKLTLPKVSNLKTLSDLVRFVSQGFDQLQTLLTHNLSFSDNSKTSFVTVTFAKANVQQAIQHALGKVPSGYIVVESANAGVVYDGTSAKTTQYLYLQCSVAETKTLMIF